MNLCLPHFVEAVEVVQCYHARYYMLRYMQENWLRPLCVNQCLLYKAINLYNVKMSVLKCYVERTGSVPPKHKLLSPLLFKMCTVLSYSFSQAMQKDWFHFFLFFLAKINLNFCFIT